MRIKRQRRKLRGKYSGNCLSCAAKWSKCWYIASVDKQREWENRLRVVVTPVDDEVCFQCWDAKIRTSPKRKIHYKAELVPIDSVGTTTENGSAATQSPLNSAKRAQRIKRACTLRVPDLSLEDKYSDSNSSEEEHKPSKKRKIGHYPHHHHHHLNSSSEIDPITKDQSSPDLQEGKGDIRGHSIPIIRDLPIIRDHPQPINTEVIEESIILDEENAVILLSTAFQTIPFTFSHGDIFVNHAHSGAYNPEDLDLSDDEFNQAKKRGAYYCGKCGKLKKGHVCVSSGPVSPTSDPSPTPTTSQCTTLQLLQLSSSSSSSSPTTDAPLQPTYQVAVYSQ